MKTARFEEHYRRLNPEQKRAVDSIEGPVMVIAGPGTGKTQILTLRIANILRRTDADPNSVLAITFTESGVHSMRKRLVEIIGPAAYSVSIYTFHGFSNEVIKRYPEEFPRIIGSSPISEIDQIRVIENIILGGSWTRLKPFGDPYFHIRDIVGAISTLKRENVGVADFKKRTQIESALLEAPSPKKGKKEKGESAREEAKKRAEKNSELAEVYRLYEDTLMQERLYDYNDMVLEVVRALEKNKKLLLKLQEEYHYILADEHQDANQSQNKLLELLGSFHESPNLFIVGDEKQAIFRFQGASLENFLYFKKRFKDAILINLVENYRSTQTILDASHSLITKSPSYDPTLRTRLHSQKGKGTPVEVIRFPDDDAETAWIAKDIAKKLKNGARPGGIAVLYRNNKDADDIMRALESLEIPFSVESSEYLFSDDDIRKLVTLLRVIGDLSNERLLGETLFIDFLGVPTIDAYQILKEASRSRRALITVLADTQGLSRLPLKKPKTAKEFLPKLESWSREAHNKNLISFFESFLRATGFLAHLFSIPGSMDKLEKLDTLLTEMRKLVESDRNRRLSDFLSYLDMLDRYKILIETSGAKALEESVRLMTAHRSKGLEFDTVYVTRCFEGRWGGKHLRRAFDLPIYDVSESEHEEDERRLFYVALSRARFNAILTYGRKGEAGKERLPARFLEEIDVAHLTVTAEEEDEPLNRLRQIAYTGKKERRASISDKIYLKELFLEQGLSVSALNNYLECPWKYFFLNLVRVPSVPEKHQLYGTAIHAALKEQFDRIREGEKPSETFLKAAFARNLKGLPIGSDELSPTLLKGEKALSQYFKEYAHTWVYPSIAEYRVGGVFLPIPKSKESLLLKGTLDRIDYLPNGKVRIIDYKTGKHKSRNDIEGKTKTSDGNLKRQLIFYRILLERGDKKFPWDSAELHFVEPNERGVCRSEAFPILEEEVAELEATLQKVAGEILGLSFWKKTCKKKDCEYCALRKFITSR